MFEYEAKILPYFFLIIQISESMSNGMATLSLDEYFKRWHAHQVANHERHRRMNGQIEPYRGAAVVSAVSIPVQDIVVGVLFAASGLVMEPYTGARKRGARGFASGVGIGAVGLVTKPFVGLFDAFAHISETIKDASRSVNFFEKKFKPMKKKRPPYIFGCNNILLPFNEVHARTVNFLHDFAIDDAESEVLINSEIMFLYPGEATYLAVTTARIVLFEQVGEALPKRVWQLDLDDDVTITSSLENFRHSGYVLRIERKYSQYSSDRGHMEFETGAEVETIEYESKSPTNIKENKKIEEWEGTKFKKIYEQAGALLPHAAFPSKQDNRNPVCVEILGEFRHKNELTRIHNAICCVTRRFDLVIHKTGNSNDHEGCTSFGHMHFVEEDFSMKSSDNDAPHDNFLHVIDNVPWVHFEMLQELSGDLKAMRRKWIYSDELEVYRKKEGGAPKWAIESRARCKLYSLSATDVS